MRVLFVCLTCCGVALAGRAVVESETEGPSLEDRQAAVRRALPYLARQTGVWIEQKKCTSCHQVPHALWAMNDARANGFAVDDRLKEWNRWAVAFVLRKSEGSEGTEEAARARADEAYQMLLSGATADVEADGGPAGARASLRSVLLMGQQEDGGWHATGRLPEQKRPKAETDEVTTLWSLYTLRSQDRSGSGEELELADRRSKVDLHTTSTSMEHLVLRYLLALDEGENAEATALHSKILSHQNDDGGWGWLLGTASDAMATGQVLYALSHMKLQHRREAVRRAHEFLVRTQQPGGSWRVPSTFAENEDRPYVVSNDWGTAWAVIGLMRTMWR